LKVKKDYLCGGAMADSADLVVLGAWYGTGNKGRNRDILFFRKRFGDQIQNKICTVLEEFLIIEIITSFDIFFLNLN